MNKIYLRKRFKFIRKQIKNKDEKSKTISKKVIENKAFLESNNIGIYSSLDDEVDTKYIIKYCLENNKKIAFPKIEGDEMNFYYIDSINELKNASYGIKEPDTKEIANYLDLIIVPGICFDKEMNRIGFGKGYYDKYLSKMNNNNYNKNIYKIGICFKEQLLEKEIIDASKDDIKMDMIITN